MMEKITEHGAGPGKKLASALDDHVFLITGELRDFSSRSQPAIGYVVAETQAEAIESQQKAVSNLRVTGAVSLAELKRQVRNLEAVRLGSSPVLLCGAYRDGQ